MNKLLYLALFLILLAALLRFGLAPQLETLPADYRVDAQLLETASYRASPTDPWQVSALNTRRVDQTILVNGNIAILEGALHIYFANGDLNFENSGLYGLDRRTRQNVPEYGDTRRTGQYLFPTHVKQISYSWWDPMFIGPRTAVFDHAETLQGLQVYVFKFNEPGMDETAGYSYLADVPERYFAHTDGQGLLWVEPVSGSLVDYMDDGVSYFVDKNTGAHLADFNQWSERYTVETRAAQIKLARLARLRMLALELWAPAAAGLLGLACLAGWLWLRRKYRHHPQIGSLS